MVTINLYEAKAHLSSLIERVLAGEEIVISRHGKPAARLVPVDQGPRPAPGAWQGKVWMSEDFEQSDVEVAALFLGDDA